MLASHRISLFLFCTGFILIFFKRKRISRLWLDQSARDQAERFSVQLGIKKLKRKSKEVDISVISYFNAVLKVTIVSPREKVIVVIYFVCLTCQNDIIFFLAKMTDNFFLQRITSCTVATINVFKILKS
jgi:hypothetical protein